MNLTFDGRKPVRYAIAWWEGTFHNLVIENNLTITGVITGSSLSLSGDISAASIGTGGGNLKWKVLTGTLPASGFIEIDSDLLNISYLTFRGLTMFMYCNSDSVYHPPSQATGSSSDYYITFQENAGKPVVSISTGIGYDTSSTYRIIVYYV